MAGTQRGLVASREPSAPVHHSNTAGLALGSLQGRELSDNQMPLNTQRWKDTSIPDELHIEILTLKEYNASEQKSKRTDSSAYEITLKLQKSF